MRVDVEINTIFLISYVCNLDFSHPIHENKRVLNRLTTYIGVLMSVTFTQTHTQCVNLGLKQVNKISNRM